MIHWQFVCIWTVHTHVKTTYVWSTSVVSIGPGESIPRPRQRQRMKRMKNQHQKYCSAEKFPKFPTEFIKYPTIYLNVITTRSEFISG